MCGLCHSSHALAWLPGPALPAHATSATREDKCWERAAGWSAPGDCVGVGTDVGACALAVGPRAGRHPGRRVLLPPQFSSSGFLMSLPLGPPRGLSGVSQPLAGAALPTLPPGTWAATEKTQKRPKLWLVPTT